MIMRSRAAARSTGGESCGHARVCFISPRRMRREGISVVEANHPLNQLHHSRVPVSPRVHGTEGGQQFVKQLALALTQHESTASWSTWFVPLLQLLAHGHPVSVDELAAAIGQSSSVVAAMLPHLPDAADWLAHHPGGVIVSTHDAFTLGRWLIALRFAGGAKNDMACCAV